MSVTVTIYGVCAVSFMMVMYALESRSRHFTLGWNVVGIVILGIAAVTAWHLPRRAIHRRPGPGFPPPPQHPRHRLDAALTALAMFALAFGKARVGRALDNPVLRTEGRVTLVDGLLPPPSLPGWQLFAAILNIPVHRTSLRSMLKVMSDDPVLVTMRRARQLTGLSGGSLRRWTREGRLPDRRSAGNQRVFLLDELEAAAGYPLAVRKAQGQAVVVGYARVSSRRQAAEGDLDSQIGRLQDWAATERPEAELRMFSDVASGLSDRRAGLRRALAYCQRPEATELVVTHPERLARFGTRALEQLLAGFGVPVVAVGEDNDLSGSAESELVRDMLAVVTSFSGRLYGQRSAKARALESCVRRGTK